jgi:carboxyl-terminal processing protease
MLFSERNLGAELAIEDASENARDILLNEAAHVLSDGVGLLQADARFASGRQPSALH